MRDLGSPGHFPTAVLVCKKDALSEKLLGNFQKGMIKANQSKEGKDLMKWCGVTGFEAIPDNYEELLGDVLKNYPAVPPALPVHQPEEVKNTIEVKNK